MSDYIKYTDFQPELLKIGKISSSKITAKEGIITNWNITLTYDGRPFMVLGPYMMSSQGLKAKKMGVGYTITFKLDDVDPEWHGESQEDGDCFWVKYEERVRDLLYNNLEDCGITMKGTPLKTIKFDEKSSAIYWHGDYDKNTKALLSMKPYFKCAVKYTDFDRVEMKKTDPNNDLLKEDINFLKEPTKESNIKRTEFYSACRTESMTAKSIKCLPWKCMMGVTIEAKPLIDLSRVTHSGTDIFMARRLEEVYVKSKVKRSTGAIAFEEQELVSELKAKKMHDEFTSQDLDQQTEKSFDPDEDFGN